RDAVGQGRRARVRTQDVEGTRAARGHAHRRLRRRDRGDDRRGGVRGSRRAGQANRGARHARTVLARAREGVHPAGRRRGRGNPGAGGVLMATTSAVDVVMPQMGVSVSEGTITKWMKSVGDPVAADESLLEISTDKVDTEVPSPGSGVVQEILVQEGETVPVGTLLARIGAGGAPAAPAPEPAAPAEPEPGAEQPVAGELVAEPPARAERGRAPAGPPPASAAPPEPAPATAGNGAATSERHTFVSPVVARIAAEHGIDPSTVPGTGRDGRVTKKDILAVVERAPAEAALPPPPAAPAPAAAPAPTPAPAPPRPAPVAARAAETIEPMTPMRRGIAEHMRRSLDTAAHVTSAIEVDMSKVVSIRESLKGTFKASYGVNLTYLAFISRATVETLREWPYLNAEIRGE